jgi:hypothetical protein
MFTLIMTLVKGDFNNGVVIRPNVFKSLLVKEIIYLPLLEDCYSIARVPLNGEDIPLAMIIIFSTLVNNKVVRFL